MLPPGLLSLLPYTSGPPAQGWHAHLGWPQPPRLCPRTPPTIPTPCVLSVPQQSFNRSSQAHAIGTFPASRVPLPSQKCQGDEKPGSAEAGVDPCLWTPASIGLSATFFPWPSRGSHTTGPAACWTDPSQIPLDTGVSCPRTLYWEGFRAGLG